MSWPSCPSCLYCIAQRIFQNFHQTDVYSFCFYSFGYTSKNKTPCRKKYHLDWIMLSVLKQKKPSVCNRWFKVLVLDGEASRSCLNVVADSCVTGSTISKSGLAQRGTTLRRKYQWLTFPLCRRAIWAPDKTWFWFLSPLFAAVMPMHPMKLYSQ